MSLPRRDAKKPLICTVFVVIVLLSAGAVIPIGSATATTALKTAQDAGQATLASAPASTSYDQTMGNLRQESPPATKGLVLLTDLQIRSILPPALLEKFPEFYSRAQRYLGDPATVKSDTFLAKVRSWISSFSTMAADPQNQSKGLAMTNPGLVDPAVYSNYNNSGSMTSGNNSGSSQSMTYQNTSNTSIDNTSAFGMYWTNYTKTLTLFSLGFANNYVNWTKHAKIEAMALATMNLAAFYMILKRMTTTPHQDRFSRFAFLMFLGILAIDSLFATYIITTMNSFKTLLSSEANICLRTINAATMKPIANLQGGIYAQSIDALAQNATVGQFSYLLGCDGTNMSQGWYSLYCREAAENQPPYLKAPPPPGQWRIRVDVPGYQTFEILKTPKIPTHGTFYVTVLLHPK